MDTLKAILIGSLTFCGVTVAYIIILDWFERATGIFGMGPCGSGFEVLVLVIMFLGGPFLGIVAGVSVGRRFIKAYSVPTIIGR